MGSRKKESFGQKTWDGKLMKRKKIKRKEYRVQRHERLFALVLLIHLI